MRKIKVKAKMLEDADVQFISIVDRPANRTPFRVMKVERTTPESSMIELGKRFFSKIASDGAKETDDVMTARPVVAGVTVRKSADEAMQPRLTELGFDLSAATEADGVRVYKMAEHDGLPLVLSEDVVVFLGDEECVRKSFHSFTESASFEDNMKVGGLIPGIAMSTEILMDTIQKSLFAAQNRADAVQKFRGALDSYSKHVISLVKGLPDTVFKMEAQMWAETAATAVAVTDEEIAVKEDNATDAPEVQAAAVEPATEEVEVKKAETPEEAVVEAETPVVPAEAVAEAAPEAPVEKAETPDFAGMLTAALGPLMENVTKLAESVNALAGKHTELEAKVVETAQKADSTAEAVRGTVVSRASDDDYNPLGLREQSGRRKRDGDTLWGGTSLDKIAGS